MQMYPHKFVNESKFLMVNEKVELLVSVGVMSIDLSFSGEG